MPQLLLSPIDPNLARHDGAVTHLRFDPTGRWLATSGTDVEVCVSAEDGQIRRFDVRARLPAFRSNERIRDLAFSPDGRLLFVSGAERLHCFEVTTGVHQWEYLGPNMLAFLHNPSLSLVPTEDGGVITAFDAGTFARFSADGRVFYDRPDNDAPAWLAPAGDGRTIVGADGFRITTWDAESGKKLTALNPGERIFGFAYEPHGRLVAVRTYGSVNVWQVEDGQCVHRFPQTPGMPVLAWSPDRRWLAVGEADGFTLWSLDGSTRKRLEVPGVRLTSIAFGSGGRVFAGDSAGAINSWNEI